jgi:hypothetical protein
MRTWIFKAGVPAICLMAVAGAVALSGCGSGSGPDGASQTAAQAAHRRAVTKDDGLSAGAVSGVAPPGAGPTSVQVKFDLKARPDPGQPLDVDLVIVPVYGNIERISGKVVGDDGLEIVGGQDVPMVEKPAEGTPLRYSVRILPKRDGVFTLSAILLVDSAGQSTNQTFSVPVIAGAAVPDAPPRSASAAPAPQGAAAAAAGTRSAQSPAASQ